MNSFSYNPTRIFKDTSAFPNPTNETNTREQFSLPLEQVRDYINRITCINADGNVVRLRLTETMSLEYSADNSNWFDVKGLSYTVVGTVDD